MQCSLANTVRGTEKQDVKSFISLSHDLLCINWKSWSHLFQPDRKKIIFKKCAFWSTVYQAHAKPGESSIYKKYEGIDATQHTRPLSASKS